MPAEFDQCAQTYTQAVSILAGGQVTRVSLDHDLGAESEVGSGYRVACWIEEAAYHRLIPCLEWTIHSMNPVGAIRMRDAMQNADVFWATQEELEPARIDRKELPA